MHWQYAISSSGIANAAILGNVVTNPARCHEPAEKMDSEEKMESVAEEVRVLQNKELLRLLYKFVTPQEKRTLAAAW